MCLSRQIMEQSGRIFNLGLTTHSIACLATIGDNIFAGTQTGVWKYFYPQQSVTEVNDVDGGNSLWQLGQNQPNPFTDATDIPFVVNTDAHVKIKIYTVAGEQVTTIVDGQYAAGSYKQTWNSNQLPAGVYLYKIETESFTETKEMILVK